MRNGSADHWFFVQVDGVGAGLVGLDHESEAFRARAVDPSGVPDGLRGALVEEPAFEATSSSFLAWRLNGDDTWVWAEHGLADGAAGLLAHVLGSAEDYCDFASDYFELRRPDERLVRDVLGGKLVDREAAQALRPEVDWSAIAGELADMQR